MAIWIAETGLRLFCPRLGTTFLSATNSNSRASYFSKALLSCR